MEFSQEPCWSGLSFPPLGDLPNPGIELVSPALAGQFFTTELPGKPSQMLFHTINTIVCLCCTVDKTEIEMERLRK